MIRIYVLKFLVNILLKKNEIAIAKLCIDKQWYKYGNIVFSHNDKKPLLNTFYRLHKIFKIDSGDNHLGYDDYYGINKK